MALVTKDSRLDKGSGLDATTGMYAPQISGLIAGEDLDSVAPCYVNADGRVYMSTGAAANAAAKVDGFTPSPRKAGEPVTLYGAGTRFRYSAGGLTPGQQLYLGATKGRLDDAATTGDAVGTARAITTTDIRVTRVQ